MRPHIEQSGPFALPAQGLVVHRGRFLDRGKIELIFPAKIKRLFEWRCRVLAPEAFRRDRRVRGDLRRDAVFHSFLSANR